MRIVSDVFPAHVAVVPAGFMADIDALKSYPPTDGAYYVEKTRVIVTDTHILIATDSLEGPVIVFREEYADFYPTQDTKKDSRIVTVSGKMLAFKKDTNCGCGSRLRGWNPYKTLNSIKD